MKFAKLLLCFFIIAWRVSTIPFFCLFRPLSVTNNVRRKAYKKLFTLVLVVGCVWIFWCPEEFVDEEHERYKLREVQDQLRDTILFEKGSGCIMPKLDPFHIDMMVDALEKYLPSPTCGGMDWVECCHGTCKVKDEILETYNDVVCTYRDLLFINGQYHYEGSPVMLYGRQAYNLNRSDHIKVSCKVMSAGFGPLKRLLPLRWKRHKSALRPLIRKPSPPGRDSSPNVLIIALDSISSNGFIRRMPRSYSFLKKELGAVFIKSFNIVGTGALAALFALFTGNSELENTDSIRRRTVGWTERKSYDSFMYTIMREDGYRTAYFGNIGFYRTLRMHGFLDDLADHYLYSEDVENNWWLVPKSKHCVGSEFEYRWKLNLTEQFLHLDGKHFCFTFLKKIYSKDFRLEAEVDIDLVAFLKRIKNKGILKNTMFVLLGINSIKSNFKHDTYQRKIEERLPLLSIILPDTFLKGKPTALRSLQANADLLTTVFDLYKTILEVVGLKQKGSNNYTVTGSETMRALSMLEPIPVNRTCSEAGIVPYYCACTQWFPLSNISSSYEMAAFALLDYVNDATKQLRDICTEWKLRKIDWVMLNSPRRELLEFKLGLSNIPRRGMNFMEKLSAVEFYQVKISLSPLFAVNLDTVAVFKGLLSYNFSESNFQVDSKSVDRRDDYGHNGDCLLNTFPRKSKFCFCNNITEEVVPQNNNEQYLDYD